MVVGEVGKKEAEGWFVKLLKFEKIGGMVCELGDFKCNTISGLVSAPPENN